MTEYWKQQEEKREWLKALKEGDEVAFYSGFSSHPKFRKVTHTTANFVEVDIVKFRRADGSCVDKTRYNRQYIAPPTAELKAEIAEQKLRGQLLSDVSKINYDNFTNEQLAAFLTLAKGEPSK